MDFSQILLNTQSPDANLRNNAEQFLAQNEAHNLGHYLTSLTAELVDENKNPQARMVAGIVLKNRLTSQNEAKRQQFYQEWLALDPAIRDNIKNGILHTLGSAVVYSTAAAVCSCIAQIELPNNLWPQLLDILLQNTKSTNEHLRKGTLLTLGYICEEIVCHYLLLSIAYLYRFSPLSFPPHCSANLLPRILPLLLKNRIKFCLRSCKA
jgi:importin subunit beta-1